VSLKEESRPPQRRRGKALEDAILTAAWEELLEHGYAGFTIDGVARRAATSRPVVYRRWATRQELVREAVVHRIAGEDRFVPATGSLRGDLIAALTTFNERRAGMITMMTLRLGGYYEETGTSLADLREALIAAAGGTSVEEIMQRAVERGEIDPERLTPRIAALPFDLFRHELLMTLRPASQETIEEIVDTIFLPLVAP
jgi:AcrR family transcriptional regulator